MPETPPTPQLIHAEDISAQEPIDSGMRYTLSEHGVSEGYLDSHIARNRGLITGDLDELQIAIAMSRREDISPVVGLQDRQPIAQRLSDFAVSQVISSPPVELSRKQVYDIVGQYDTIRRYPVEKMGHDIGLATTYLRRLGPRNPLRQDDGYDAAFEISGVKRLLEADFLALPETEQKPELRMTEALLAEELALLWTPGALSKARLASKKGSGDMIANPADANLFDEQQLQEVSEKERWRDVGAKLCNEAAELFESIYLSKTAPAAVRIEAVGRMADMSIRSLQLQRSSATTKADKQAIEAIIDRIATQHMTLVTTWWNTQPVRRAIQTGKIFESVCLAKERSEMIAKGNYSDTIRLAMPREDDIHEKIGPVFNRNDTKLNMSVDIVVEDTNGNKVVCYQSKAMSEAEYEKKMNLIEAEKGSDVVYPDKRIQMRFLDSDGYGDALQPAA